MHSETGRTNLGTWIPLIIQLLIVKPSTFPIRQSWSNFLTFRKDITELIVELGKLSKIGRTFLFQEALLCCFLSFILSSFYTFRKVATYYALHYFLACFLSFFRLFCIEVKWKVIQFEDRFKMVENELSDIIFVIKVVNCSKVWNRQTI